MADFPFASDAPAVIFDENPVDFDPWKRNRIAEKKVHRENFWERAGDAYISLLAAAIVFAYAAGIAHAFSASLKEDISGGVIRNGIGVIPGESAASALVMLGMLAALSLISRLGPVAVDGAQGFWWLTLPVSRTPFLARLLRQRLVTTAVLGVLLWLPIGYGTVLGGLSKGGFTGVMLGALSLGLLFVVLSLLAALAQARGWARGFKTSVNIVILVLALCYGADVLMRITGAGTLQWFWRSLPSVLPAAAQEGQWWIPLVLLVVALAGFRAIRGHLQNIDRNELISRGAASAHAGAALALLDDKSLSAAIENAGTKESSRALARREHIRRRGGDVFSRLLSASSVRGPYSALIRAELLVLLRAPGVWRGLLAGWAIPAAGVFAIPGGHPLVLGTLVVVGCCVAARAAATAASQAADVPSLESIIPLGRTAIRQTHALVALILLVPWGVALTGFLGWAVDLDAASLPLFLAIGALAGAGLAAGGIRLAYRPELDWGSVMLLSALGKATGPMIQHFTHGYDVMVVATIALVAGLLLTPVPPLLLLVSAVVAAVLWAAGTSTTANSKVHGID